MEAMHKTALAVNIAFLIERCSRFIVPKPPSTPPARLQFSNATVGLSLQETLYAARQPPARVVILREDEYFVAVKTLLEEI